MSEFRRRDVNSILRHDDELIYESDYEDDDDNSRKNKSNKKHDKKNNEKTWNNPVDKIIREEVVYDKNKIYKALIKQDGLYKMITDLKEWSKNPKNKKPQYIYHILRDIAVAAALPDAIDELKKSDKYDISKKDFELLMDEILSVIKNSNDNKLVEKYGSDSVEAIREAYISILYKFNKKKVKKLRELDIDEGLAKKLVVLTAGKNPNNSIYSLLKYIYKHNSEYHLNEKLIVKILKICYGKDMMPEVIKCIMLEKINPLMNNPFNRNDNSKVDSSTYVLIDKIMRDQLESMSKKDIKNIILSYVRDRKIAKRRGDNTKRRFGDRRTIHPDDYPKLTKVLEELESDDFSIIEYLR